MARSANACPQCGAKRWGGKSKLKACRSCGNAVAKSANACPHCGAKQNQGLYALCAVILVFAVFAFVGVIIGSLNDSPTRPASMSESHTQTDQPKETLSPIEISASSLWSAYEENKVNADNLYKNQTVAVTGTISDITQDLITKNPCVNLSTGDSYNLYPIQCFFDGSDETKSVIAELRDGDTITIIGKCSGTPILCVQVSNCAISK